MPKVTYVSSDGSRRAVEVPVGTSVMQAAIANGIDGIVAECGGSLMCATCHVYVDEVDLGRVPAVGPVEAEMLECTAAERRTTSRLSCQLVVLPALDGLVVHLPATQI
jgi:ferredoxin, 2Fe-2S